MKRTVLTVAAAIACMLTSCTKDVITGSGPVVTEVRSQTGFHGVSSECVAKVNFKVDPVYKVEIQAQENILEVLRTRVISGVLHIDFPNDVRIRRHDDIIINISAPSADYFRVSGSGDIRAEGALATNRLDLQVSGSGSIVIQQAAIADKLDVRISGSGNISIASGSAKNEDLQISGSGNMDFSNVTAERAETRISGSGDMKVNLSQNLDAHISGSGSVYYRGNPQISTHISGSGKVRPL